MNQKSSLVRQARSVSQALMSETFPHRNCLVAERYWDQVGWAIEEYAWRFEALMSPPKAPSDSTGGL